MGLVYGVTVISMLRLFILHRVKLTTCTHFVESVTAEFEKARGYSIDNEGGEKSQNGGVTKKFKKMGDLYNIKILYIQYYQKLYRYNNLILFICKKLAFFLFIEIFCM